MDPLGNDTDSSTQPNKRTRLNLIRTHSDTSTTSTDDDTSIESPPALLQSNIQHNNRLNYKHRDLIVHGKQAIRSRVLYNTFYEHNNEVYDECIHDRIPHKIIQLQSLCMKYQNTKLQSIIQLPCINDYRNKQITDSTDNWQKFYGSKLSNIQYNSELHELQHLVKCECDTILHIMSIVKLFISLHVPTQEDGSNVGVEIQESILDDIDKIESNIFSIIDTIYKHSHNRSRIAIKCMKYPYVEDYHYTIMIIDDTHYNDLVLCLVELQQHYIHILDLVQKNDTKIREPTTDHHKQMI